MKDQTTEKISKVLSGEASAEEKKDLRQALLESEQDNLLFNRIREYWDADVALADKEQWSGFEESVIEKLGRGASSGKMLRRRIAGWAASAAAVVLLISTGFLLYKHIADPAHYITYATQSAAADYTLEDGTQVRLNSNSSLTLKHNYGRKRREVSLEGEGYFVVRPDAVRPFVVEAAGTKTRVLGTSFNLKVAGDRVTTTLVEGSVMFSAAGCEVMLEPGNEVWYDTATGTYDSYRIDTQFSTAWVTGRFTYQSIAFGELVSKLEEIYGLRITVTDEKIAQRKVYASFRYEEPVGKILDAMKTQLGFNYNTTDPGDIIITPQRVK